MMGKNTCAPCFEGDDYFDRIYKLTESRLNAVKKMTLIVLSHYVKKELVQLGIR